VLDALESIDQELTTERSRPKNRAWVGASGARGSGDGEEKAALALLVDGLAESKIPGPTRIHPGRAG